MRPHHHMPKFRPGKRRPHRTLGRTVRATLRDASVVLRETGSSLLLLVTLWLSFGLTLWRWYRPGDTVPSLAQALYYALQQMVFEPLTLPTQLPLQMLFFVVPAIGLTLAARGGLSAAVLLFDKHTRREAWHMALASTYSDHIIVCGLGKVGYRMVGQLRGAGQEVVVVQRAPRSEFYDLVVGLGVPVITGDARQPETLLQAGLLRAHSICAVTGDDLTNLDMALTARELRPGMRIVMRVFNDALARKLGTAFNIKTAFSTSALAAPTFAAAAISRDVQNAIYVGGQFLVTQEVRVSKGGALDGRLVEDVEQSYDVSVLFRQNEQGNDLRPGSHEQLRVGDLIVVIGVLESLDRLATENELRAASRK